MKNTVKEKKSTQIVVFNVMDEKFCQPCSFIQAYSFITDLVCTLLGIFQTKI
jgi:hypothetical protein